MWKEQRYLITDELRNAIKNSPYSQRKLSKVLGFSVKNVCVVNKTINERHLNRIRGLLNFNAILKEIKYDFTKNLHPNHKPQYFKPLIKNEEMAEFIGIMLGDGYLGEPEIKVCFDKRDKIYFNYVKILFKKIFGITLKEKFYEKNNSAYLYCYSKKLGDELIKVGLIRGNKIKNNVGIPYWIKENKTFSKRCIKGLVDTDGCIFVCKREKQKYINFTNYDQKLFTDFLELTNNLGYHFAKSNNRNLRLYRKKEVARFINEIKPLKAKIGVVV